MNKHLLLFFFLLLTACSGIENQGINLEEAKSSPLLTPPCLNK